MNCHFPPGLGSISQTFISNRSLAPHCSAWARSVRAWKPRCGGAAIWTSATTASWSGVMMASIMIGSCARRVESLLAPEIKHFLHLFAVVNVVPLLGVMIRIQHGDDDVI